MRRNRTTSATTGTDFPVALIESRYPLPAAVVDCELVERPRHDRTGGSHAVIRSSLGTGNRPNTSQPQGSLVNVAIASHRSAPA
jgi:hypothetical protein